ncbi:MAG: VCBS domain-containing protein, partial [Burkholderiales bacterium]
AGGQEVQDSFSYGISDGFETAGAALTVTVAGTNDAPLAEDLAAIADEDGPAITLMPAYSDADAPDTHMITVGAFGNTGFELGGFAGWQLSDAALGDVLSGGALLGERYASLRSGAGQDTYSTLSRNFTLAASESLSGLADFVAGDALPYDDDAYVLVGLLGGASTLLFGASVASVGDYGETGWVPFEFIAPVAGTYVLQAGVRNGQDNSVDSRLLLDGVEQFRPAAGVTVNADGTFDYDPGGRFEWLAEGEFATDAFSYIVTDDFGAQAVATATVQIVGANDAPEIGAAMTEALVTEENSLPSASELGAQGAITFSDVDLSDAHLVQVGTLDAGFLGEFTAQLATDSTGGGEGNVQWSFAVTNGELDALGESETLEQAYEVLVEDSHGGSASRIVTVTLAGVNDAPQAQDDVAQVQEDGVLVATGNVLANDFDVDAHDVLGIAIPGSVAGAYGTLLLLADGTYRYELDNAAVQSLAAGQDVQEVFAYEATDGRAATAATLTVTIAGANDAPVVLGDAASVREDRVLTAIGNVLDNDLDVDANSTLRVGNPGTYLGSFGTLNLEADGSYFYALDNAAVQFLADEQQVTDTFSYAASDGIASTPGTLTVTIIGTNDAPVTQDDTANVREDVVLSASGNVLANYYDVDSGTTLTVANAGLYGSLALAANGDYTYTLDNASAAVQGLRAGEVVTDPFTYLASDGLESTPGTITVSVFGTNDVPFAQNDAGAAQEDGGPVTLLGATLLDNDTDADFGDTKNLVAVTNSAGGAQVTLVGGNAVYNVGSLFQTLKAGATALDSFAYTMVDSAGASSTATVAMTITGVNDAPVVAAPIPDQNATAGTAFSFAFAPSAFTDIDFGDTLAYSASLADGTALPSWLTFNGASRTFAGTPPADISAQVLSLRATATDTAGASASDVFALTIAGGTGDDCVPIVGTDGDDTLTGTPGNDIIDGRKGYDVMRGGAGDDVYFVDKSGGKIDLVVEGAVAGYDTVYSSASYTLPANVEELHLIGHEDLEGRGNALANMLIGNSGDNRLYGMAGNDLLLDDAGDDLLDGGDGDDVLDGGRGNDVLIGGKGNDLFVHAKGGGHDLVQDSGGQDAIRFGYGIATGDVTVRRDKNDLVLLLSGGNGSVTAKDWFGSSSKRVEQVQFADGTVWNESAIRARVTTASSGEQGGYGGYYDHGPSYGGGEQGADRDDDHDDHDDHDHDDDDHERNGLFDAIAARLKSSPDYDFTALAAYLQRQGGGGYGAMTPEQIASRWVKVQDCIASLAPSDGDCDGGYGGKGQYGGYGCDDDRSNGGWGYAGSTGQNSGCGGMAGLSGLGEGFQKL